MHCRGAWIRRHIISLVTNSVTTYNEDCPNVTKIERQKVLGRCRVSLRTSRTTKEQKSNSKYRIWRQVLPPRQFIHSLLSTNTHCTSIYNLAFFFRVLSYSPNRADQINGTDLQKDGLAI